MSGKHLVSKPFVIGRLKRRTMSEVEEPEKFKSSEIQPFHGLSLPFEYLLRRRFGWRLNEVLRSRGVGNGFLFRFTLEDVPA